MTLPWDNQPRPAAPQQPYTPPPAPRPQPAPQPAPAMPAQDMQPDIKPQNKDLNTLIQEAINEAIIQNRDKIQANAQRALVKTVKGEKPTVKHHRKVVQGDGTVDEIEDSFEGGPVTTRTFLQGMLVDVGFAVMAAVATVASPGFNAFDKEAWTITGVLVLKTAIQTGMSYVMKLDVK